MSVVEREENIYPYDTPNGFKINANGEGDDLKSAAFKMYKSVLKVLDEIYREVPLERQLKINRVIWEQQLEEESCKLGKNQNTKFGFSCN